MPGKEEKERRKQIMDDISRKQKEAFEQSLPMTREQFAMLFDYLDEALTAKDCDHTNRHTRLFLQQNGIDNYEDIFDWLSEYGGYCDCEILTNVEGHFE